MITAASNSRIKRLVQLNQKSKLRRTEDVFLAEGVKMFLEAPREQLQEVYVSESFLEKCSCREHLEEVGYEVVSDSVFSKISDTCIRREEKGRHRAESARRTGSTVAIWNGCDAGKCGRTQRRRKNTGQCPSGGSCTPADVCWCRLDVAPEAGYFRSAAESPPSAGVAVR